MTFAGSAFATPILKSLRKGVMDMEFLVAFLISVLAGITVEIITYFWRNRKKKK